MLSVVIDLLIVLWLVVFGALAFVPLVLGAADHSPRQPAETEDRVLSVAPSRSTPHPAAGLGQTHEPDHLHAA